MYEYAKHSDVKDMTAWCDNDFRGAAGRGLRERKENPLKQIF